MQLLSSFFFVRVYFFWFFGTHFACFLWMLLAVLHFCQLMDDATVLNIQTGNLMFTPKKDQYLNTIEQTSFFKHN